MKKTMKEFKKDVKRFRNFASGYNHGREVVVLDEYTKKGQSIIDQASRHQGVWLHDVYSYWSDAKDEAFHEVYEMYSNDPDAHSFGICSHCSNFFTVSWISRNKIFFFTHMKEYVVICNE